MKKISLLILLFAAILQGFSQSIFINSLAKSSYCQGDSSSILFETTGLFNTDNSFKIELCQTNGTSFQNPIYIGEKTSSNVGIDSILFAFPNNLQNTTACSYRIISSSPIIVSNTIFNLSLLPKSKFDFSTFDSMYCLTENPVTFSSLTNEYLAEFSGNGIKNNIFTPKIAGEGSHYIYCRTTNTHNCISIDSTKIKVTSTPKPFVSFIDSICNVTTLNITAIGDSILWYSDSSLNKTIYKGEKIQYFITDTLSHAIYATQTDNNCKSEAQKITFTYKIEVDSIICYAQKPNLYTLNTTLCEGSTANYSITAHYSAINNIKWFDAQNYTIANNISNDSIMYFKNNNKPGNWIYYAYEYDSVNNCYSDVAAEFMFTVRSKPTLTMKIPDTACFAVKSYQINVQPQGGVIFGPGIDGNELHPEASFLKNEYDTISYTYADSYGCIGTIKKASFIHFVNLPTLSDKTGYLDSIPQLYAFGDNFTNVVSWFSDITKPAINTGNYYTPEINNTGIYTYFVSQKEKGCSSDLVPIELTVNTRTNTLTITDNNQFLISPNPARNTIFFPEIIEGQAYIYTTAGVEIQNDIFWDGKINIHKIPSGLYVLKVFANQNIYTAKLVKL